MARGDFIGDIVEASATSYVDAQPSSGDEWVVKAWGVDSAWVNYRLHVYDGTDRVRIAQADKSMAVFNGQTALSLPVDYSTYLSIYNGGAGALKVFYSGYKTKE